MGKSRQFAIEYDTMAKSKKNDELDEQGKLFIKAARKAGCSEDEAVFDENIKKIARHKQPVTPQPALPRKPRSK
jgi:hypothetical protein